MRLIPSDPDVETIVSRIEAQDLDLQPEFQRGEVWSKAKKQRLVDSILRDWHIPPIHVIQLKDSRKQEVLDGQQRLVSIRDFHRNEFAIDGKIEPIDPAIEKLHGMRFRDLTDDWKRQFNQFTIRVFRIVDYKPSEPGELFFRLNQPANLTAAEQRNAFFGPVREQIKELVETLPALGVDRSLIGFSNSRMSYDDILCRAALTVERNSISEKVTAADLIDLYRSESALSDLTMTRVREALALLGESKRHTATLPKFNKATLYSWLIFLVRSKERLGPNVVDPVLIGRFLTDFESDRVMARIGLQDDDSPVYANVSPEWLYKVYEDRSTSRVADVSSVVLRDAATWLLFSHFAKKLVSHSSAPLPPKEIASALDLDSTGPPEEETFFKRLVEAGWGKLQ